MLSWIARPRPASNTALGGLGDGKLARSAPPDQPPFSLWRITNGEALALGCASCPIGGGPGSEHAGVEPTVLLQCFPKGFGLVETVAEAREHGEPRFYAHVHERPVELARVRRRHA